MSGKSVAELVAPVSTGAVEAVVEAPVSKVTLTKDEIEAQALDLELKRYELLEKKANLEDINERLAERQMRRHNIRQLATTNGATINVTLRDQAQVQGRCNHRKGGNSMNEVITGQGTSVYFALMKHRMLNGDLWIRCLRCGKTWKPPVRSSYPSDVKYQEAVVEYEAAKMLPTNNSPSSSYTFAFSDGGQHFREVTKDSTLR